ncbi:MAG: hypothetical protein ACYTEQ_21720 [Planctomycetota bacterium]|jgi:hypothetical protein
MAITKTEDWEKCVEINKDPYGKACVDVARRVMELLDAEPGEFDPHKLICRADDDIDAGGLTGFMAGCVAQMVSACHSRGEDFRRKWNLDSQIHDEGEKANESGGILNPAVLTVETPES